MKKFQVLVHLASAIATAILLLSVPASAAGGTEWIVSPQGPLITIQEALDKAQPGDTIIVQPGTYLGPVIVEKAVSLLGQGWPVIDGGEQGTVVTLNADSITFSGFEVRGSGVEPDRDHAGITLSAADIRVENNRLRDVLFGIFVAQADRAVVINNDISSKPEYDIARKGDAIRVWYSQDVRLEANHVHDARDVVAWYAQGVHLAGNRIENGRYGIHLMYCDQAEITQNQIIGNSVGIYTMYSRNVLISQNDIRGQHGPSGYALGFKDADNILAQDNLMVDNRAGVFADGTPFSKGSYARFENNIFAYNDIGIILLSFVNGAEFRGNTFWENIQQTALQGSGKSGLNTWQGNYWSDYTGFDADADGSGDIPYRSERFFEGMIDREPLLRALLYSPAAQAIEFAAASFPVIKPQPKLEDLAPAASPASLPANALPAPSLKNAVSMALTGLVLLGFGLLLAGLGMKGISWMKNFNAQQKPAGAGVQNRPGLPLVQIQQLVKKYGKATVLQGINLAIHSGESVALWGANGAGKTTLIKSMLGLVDYQGEIILAGKDVRRDGKQARARVGYVPQEAVFYDMTVQATMEFYSQLKHAPSDRTPALLDSLGLLVHQHKPVPALSGGLKQRLALAVALLSDPPILLLDEPTANLDAQARKEYLATLNGLRREGKTIVFASHRIEEVEVLADRVIILENGMISDELSPGNVRLRLAPEVALTLWIAEEQRQHALDTFAAQGWQAHMNGRGTVVVQVSAEEKIEALQRLAEQGIQVRDFEMEGVGKPWN